MVNFKKYKATMQVSPAEHDLKPKNLV